MLKYRVGFVTMLVIFLVAVFDQFSIFVPEVALGADCEKKSEFVSGPNKIHLIELYSSEGCSSCPPAEKWLNSLYANKNLYKTFIPMAFHVSYWDYIGHKDPLAHEDYVRRQRSYSKEWGRLNVYTPGFVMDGKEWRPFTRSVPDSPGAKVGILKIEKTKNNTFKVSYDQKGSYILNAVLLVHGVEHRIKRGENSGKTLKHNFVVSDFQQTKLSGPTEIALKPNANTKFKEKSVAFWISTPLSQKPIQAVGGCLL